ncbi:MAG: hypothetical protein QOE23_4012 [Pseudonocardiales bacterium]|nr:hypothetical protein [Pseudonocardiales bacterium]
MQRLLDGLRRDSNITYDIQGLNDQGVDVAMRLTDAVGARFIGVQIKSHHEFVTENPTSKLIQQYHTAREYYGDDLTYYILACCDPSVPQVQDRLRDATSRFTKNSRVIVVEPAYALSFLALRPAQLDSLITQTLRTGDPIVATGRNELIGMHPLEAAILLHLVERVICGHQIEARHDDLERDTWLGAVAARADQEQRDTEQAGLAWDDPSVIAPPRFPQPLPDEEYWMHEGRVMDAYPGVRNLDPHQLAELLKPSDSRGLADPQSLIDALDSLQGDDRVTVTDTTIRLTVNESLALVTLAGEAILRHDLDGQDLIDYLIETVLL